MISYYQIIDYLKQNQIVIIEKFVHNRTKQFRLKVSLSKLRWIIKNNENIGFVVDKLPVFHSTV